MGKIIFALFLSLVVTPVFGAAGQSKTVAMTIVRGTAAPTVAEISSVVVTADTAGSLAGTYFTLHSAGDVSYDVFWYKVSGVGSAPVVSGATRYNEIDITSGATNSAVGTATNAVVDALAEYASSVSTATLTITNAGKGAATNVAAGTSGFAVSVSTAGVSSVAAISSLAKNISYWSICNDASNTSTHMYIGSSVDSELDGTAIAPGECYTCPDCNATTLGLVKVSAQAVSNGFAVVQFQK